jgi:hypothetical protein
MRDLTARTLTVLEGCTCVSFVLRELIVNFRAEAA